MGNGAGLLRRGGGTDVVQRIDTAEDIGPDKDASSGSKSPIASSAVSPKGTATLEARLRQLEVLVEQQAQQLHGWESSMAVVRRDSRRIVTVAQYNILASYLGKNTQPWFLHGAEITCEQRAAVFKKFGERDANGKPANAWPKYAEGILTPAQILEVNRRDEDFKWPSRKVRLVDQIRQLDADVLSLVELDEKEYFHQCLLDEWDMVFHKRPRAASLDGCGVFWRRSKFSLLAQHAIDFVDGSDDKGRLQRDRSCLMVLLQWRYTSAPPLVVVSTHLAKDPEDRSQTAVRVRQVTQIVEALTEFTALHSVSEAPVVLCGDLNAKHFGEIRGIARTVWQMTGSQLHKFLWCASDVPTGNTSITKARQCRIDAVQYLSGQMEVIEVRDVPRLPHGEVIPSAEHPSDHFPVVVKFRMKDAYQTYRELGRAWLECVAGQEKVHPLTQADLRSAFEFFDRDKSNAIHRHDLEEACCDLQCGNFFSDIQQVLLDCFPEQEISYENFIRAYEIRMNHERIRSIGELEKAFQFFAGGRRTIPLRQLEEAFREITPISFSDAEVKEMIRRLDLPLGVEEVDLRSFCEVVCRASFPHRDRRPFAPAALAEQDTWGQTLGRQSTKDLGAKLMHLSELNSSRGFSSSSPCRNPSTWSTNALSPPSKFDSDKSICGLSTEESLGLPMPPRSPSPMTLIRQLNGKVAHCPTVE
mmetsp:Transcript_39607/g.126965  ORF Transcript_39607/g.126965 Transcript_39607/m.126965 type:complete len:699 (-) Transcript_39607:134-2230(-)